MKPFKRVLAVVGAAAMLMTPHVASAQTADTQATPASAIAASPVNTSPAAPPGNSDGTSATQFAPSSVEVPDVQQNDTLSEADVEVEEGAPLPAATSKGLELQPGQLPATCQYRTGGPNEQGPNSNNICWFDFSSLFQGPNVTRGNPSGKQLTPGNAAGTAAGQPMLLTLGGPNNIQLTFTLRLQTKSGPVDRKTKLGGGVPLVAQDRVAVGAYQNVLWAQQYWGNANKNPSYYTTTDPEALAARHIIGASQISDSRSVVFRFDDIQIYENGTPLQRDYSFVMADAESVNRNEQIGMVSNVPVQPLALVNPTGSNQACSGKPSRDLFGTGPGGNGYFLCTGSGTSASAFYVVRAQSPKTLEAAVWNAEGSQGFALGLMTSVVTEQQTVEAVTLPDTGARDDTTFQMEVVRTKTNKAVANEAPLIEAEQKADTAPRTASQAYLYDQENPGLRFTSSIEGTGEAQLQRAARYREPTWRCYDQKGAVRTDIVPEVKHTKAGVANDLTIKSEAFINTTGPGDFHCEVHWPAWVEIGQLDVDKQLLGDGSAAFRNDDYQLEARCTLPPTVDPRRYTQAFDIEVNDKNEVVMPFPVKPGAAAVPVRAPLASNCSVRELNGPREGTSHMLRWRVDGKETAAPTADSPSPVVALARNVKKVTAINEYATVLGSVAVRREVNAPARVAGDAGEESPVAFDCGTRNIAGTDVPLTGVIRAGSAAVALPVSAVTLPAGVTAAQLGLPGEPATLGIPAGNVCVFTDVDGTLPVSEGFDWSFTGGEVTVTQDERATAVVTLTATEKSQTIGFLPLPSTGSAPILVIVTLLSALLLLAAVIRNFRRN